MKKTLLVPILATALLAVGLVSPAQALKQGQCVDVRSVNSRMCASLNLVDGLVWATGSSRQILQKPTGDYAIFTGLLRRPCSGGEWTSIASVADVGPDQLRTTTEKFRAVAGYRYRAATGQLFVDEAARSPVLSRC